MSQQSRPLPPTDVVADVVVAADGSGDARTVQEGVDLAPAGADRVVVRIEPGVYRGPVVVGPDKTGLALVGATGDPDDVVIVDDRANGTPRPGGGTWGTAGSATVTVAGDGFEARHVTFANAFDDAAHPEIVNRQAVALRTLADRVVLDHVRLLGHQDTLFLDSPAEDVRVRVYVHDSHVQGDVDFVFGRATAVLDGCTIMALRHTGTPNGYLFAPGNDPRVVVRDSTLGRHLVVAAPWEPMHGYDWLPGRNAEHHNDGPGALVTLQRPQLAEADARAHVPATYLAGDDCWAPQRAADLSAG